MEDQPALSLILEDPDKAKETDNTAAAITSSDQQLQTTSKDDDKVQATGAEANNANEALPELQRPDVPPTADAAQRPATASGWLGWFQKPPPTQPVLTAPEPSPPAELAKPPEVQPAPILSEPATARPATAVGPEQEKAAVAHTSWFGFWGSAGSAPVDGAKKSDGDNTANVDGASETPKPSEDVVMEDAPPIAPAAPEPLQSPSAGSTWAFWSRDSGSNSKDQTASAPQAPSGELAVIGEGSEAHPQPASGVEVKDAPTSSKTSSIKDGRTGEPPGKVDKTKKSKRLRPQSMDDPSISPRPATPKAESPKKADVSKPQSSATKTLEALVKPSPPNLLLPSFKSTYHAKENPSILRQIADLLHITQQPPANHVFLSKEPPKIKKALAIGVHGLFPATYLRPMIGQPTGTSIKFANHCAEGIRRWADSHGCEDCEIEKVALEGEGKIADRVENLWKLMLNWIDHIRKADLIILACHSQGVPVGIMLVAKLIELGVINTPRIGVCAMAGVSLGPFPDYKSGLLMGSAAELWEFANPDSEISKRYEHSLKAALDYGVRLTYVGSIDDQVVPMEVSTEAVPRSKLAPFSPLFCLMC